MKIFVIEDDANISSNIREALTAEGYHCEFAFDGILAERILKRNKFDCIILDINLPGKNGFELCSEFRKFDAETPVLMLTAFEELEDKIKGFDCGADDYLTKPFFMRELLLRIQSLTRRNKQNSKFGTKISIGDIIIDEARKTVFRQEIEVKLTPREYQILLKLCRNKGEIISKEELISEIWGTSVNVNTNTIEVYVNFLRNKIDKPFNQNSIKTKVGFGYYLDIE